MAAEGSAEKALKPEPADTGRWYRSFVMAGLILSVVVGAAAFTIGQGGAQFPIRILAYLVLPVSITLSVIGSRDGRLGFLVLALALIYAESLLVAALMAMGMALTVIFPLIGLALALDRVQGRALLAVFATAGTTCVAGVYVALLYGPVSEAQQLKDPLLVGAACLLFVVFGLGHVFRLSTRRTQALATARSELESRRAAEAELERTSQVLAAIVDSSPVPTQVIGADGKVLVWNPASERVFGWTAAEVVDHELPAAMTPEDDRQDSAERIRRTIEGQTVGGERALRLTKDGREVWVDIYGGPLRSEAGEPIGIAGQLVDVTDRVAMEASLLQAAKMEAIGGLAGGIAHDFNNILTAIRGHAELVRASLGPNREEDRADLDEIILAADRAAGLTRQLLAFARRTELEPRVLDPAEVLLGFTPMLRRLLGEDIDLVIEPDPGIGRVRVDPVQLEQVILNLAVNSRDAMPAGGTLKISLANVDLDAAAAAKHHGARPGPYVEITVMDTGAGISEAVQSRIFEPFFTTKEPGKGTGMGLATVFGVVQMSDGWIDLRSKPGRGATFRLYFPRIEAAAAEAAAAEAGEATGGSETILLVEDDPAVRAFSRRCLSDLGYTVIEASSGQQALKLARARSGPIDLLLSDVIMPGIRGPELAERLSRQRPGIKVVLCSGFAGDEMGGSGGPGRTYLAKPYSVEDLAQAIRATLDRAD
jgi:PAS domain S-box-containing protein